MESAARRSPTLSVKCRPGASSAAGQSVVSICPSVACADSSTGGVKAGERIYALPRSRGILAAVAWSYVLWLAVDMDMGGMHMTGFRMVAAGVGIMAPVGAP